MLKIGETTSLFQGHQVKRGWAGALTLEVGTSIYNNPNNTDNTNNHINSGIRGISVLTFVKVTKDKFALTSKSNQ